MLAVVFAAERFAHYILGKHSIQVLSDHKHLMTIFSKPILISPKRLQRMRLRLQTYPLKVSCKPGLQMFITDTLQSCTSFTSCQNSFRKYVEEINPGEAVFVTDKRLKKSRLETSNDTSLQTVMSLIMSEWPDNILKTLLCVREYCPYRDYPTRMD